MKKFFFFAAAILAAVNLNAGSFEGFDFRVEKMGPAIYNEGNVDGGIIQNKVNITMTETDATKHKYTLSLTAAGVQCSFTIGGIEFLYTSETADDAWKTYENYIQPNGARREVHIPTVAGEQILVNLANADSDFKADGIKVDGVYHTFETGDNILIANGPELVIVSDKTKPKFSAIIPYSETALGDIDAEGAKAVKTLDENGQIVILKGGKRYNALGAEL